MKTAPPAFPHFLGREASSSLSSSGWHFQRSSSCSSDMAIARVTRESCTCVSRDLDSMRDSGEILYTLWQQSLSLTTWKRKIIWPTLISGILNILLKFLWLLFKLQERESFYLLMVKYPLQLVFHLFPTPSTFSKEKKLNLMGKKKSDKSNTIAFKNTIFSHF